MAKEKSGKDTGNNGMNKAQNLMEKLIKNSIIKGTEQLSKSSVLIEKETTSTEVAMLNVALSGKIDGGFGAGIHMICGPSRHFKSSYGLVLVAAFLRKYPNAIALIYNNEFGIKKSYLEKYGIPCDRCVHSAFESLESLRSDLTTQLDSLTEDDKVIIFCDSLANAASVREIDNAKEESNSADFSRAKVAKSLSRIITPKLHIKNIPMIVINHTYKSMNAYSSDIVATGTGFIYNSDTIWVVGKSQIKETDDVVGSNFTIKIEKSRYVKERSMIPISVRWDLGIGKYSGLAELAEEFGIIKSIRIGKRAGFSFDSIENGILQSYANKISFDENFWGIVLKDSDLSYKIEQKYSLPTAKTVSELLEGEEDEESDD